MINQKTSFTLALSVVVATSLLSSDAYAQSGSKKMRGSTATQNATRMQSSGKMLGLGQTVKDFVLPAVAGKLSGDVKLSSVAKSGPVVLVVLRGYPGYQCGLCSRQVGEWVSQASAFAGKNANVIMVYPGHGAGLEARAEEFLKGGSLPEPFTMVIDPDYKFTNAYGLRWNAPRETAYPSTFVIDSRGTITFAKISKGHGDRAKPNAVLAKL